jgi:NAD(P)H-hydrate epimerase
MRIPTRIPSTAQLRKLESDWIKKCAAGWGQVLMEIAGRGTAELAYQIWEIHPGVVLVFCGHGNNGGDGLVVARYLSLWGVPVVVRVVGDSSNGEVKMSSPEASTNYKILKEMGIVPVAAGDDTDILTDGCSLIIDALLGTGLDREVQGGYRTVIDSINRSGKPVIAVDVPSGINSDTGQIMGAAIRADLTVTFGYLKAGLLHFPGADQAGELKVIDIGLPELPEDNSSKQEPILHIASSEYVLNRIPARPKNSHKGTFGTVLTIAGSFNMPGATILVSESALRTGAGLSILAAPRSIISRLPAAEIIYRPLLETSEITICPNALKEKGFEEDLERATSIILGPGISQNKDTQRFVYELLPIIEKPCVIDADGLNAIAANPNAFPKNTWQFVLTPHPKELSRLISKSVAEIQVDRVSAARSAADKFGAVVVLKGAHTVIAGPDNQLFINVTGDSGMATAGSGDVLSGIIGGLLAQGLEPFEAAVTGVYIHGFAGDIASEEVGETGIVAGDIANAIPFALSAIRSGQRSVWESQFEECSD